MSRYNSDTLQRLYQIGGSDLALSYADRMQSGAAEPARNTRAPNILDLWLFQGDSRTPSVPGEASNGVFLQGSAQYIWFYLEVENPWRFHASTSQLVAQYRSSTGQIVGEIKDELRFSVGYRSYVYQGGIGWQAPGRWPVGNYHLNIRLDGHPAESRAFRVVSSDYPIFDSRAWRTLG